MIINTVTNNNKTSSKTTKRNNNKNKIKSLITLCIILIIGIVIYGIINFSNKNFNNVKEDKSKPLVYTRYERNEQKVPYLNINSESAVSVNKNIVDFCNNFIEYEGIKLFYEYNLNGNYLSLVIKVKTNGINNYSDILFKTYNINLKTKSYLDENYLKDYFKLTDEEISTKINNQFTKYYNEEVEEGYLDTNECNYDCFLSYREIDDITNNLNFYIKDAKLYVFIPFKTESIYAEEEYFTDESFEIQISS